VILGIVHEHPRHGYDIIREMEEKFHGFYVPSAGSVYPILQLLEDQGLVTSNQENGRKVYVITTEGKKELEENSENISHIEGRMHHRFGGEHGERLHGLLNEAQQTMHFILSKANGEMLKDSEMMKKLRIAFANFRSEVEKILSESDKGKK
jgi:DNA-binding PadR family transcriptional regulator